MSTHLPFCSGLAAVLLAGGMPDTQAQVPAIVTADRVNVRSRPSVARGEVVTQLARDQKVIIFEEGLPSAGPRDPVSEWTRIEVPAGCPVWVSADHVAMPAGTVKPAHLNVRAGPSEDYAILGTVARGTQLRSLEERNGWLRVEAPLGLSGYVAADFLRPVEQPATAEPALPVVVVPAATPGDQTNQAAHITTETNAPPASAPGQAPTPATASVRTPVPASVPADHQPPSAGPIASPPTSPVAEPETPEISPEPRIIRREGIVRATWSVQAPTPFELVAADNGRLLDYLLPLSTNVLIRPFHGQHVRILGEEYLEPRWDNAPVIVVHGIKLAP